MKEAALRRTDPILSTTTVVSDSALNLVELSYRHVKSHFDADNNKPSSSKRESGSRIGFPRNGGWYCTNIYVDISCEGFERCNSADDISNFHSLRRSYTCRLFYACLVYNGTRNRSGT
jgi:hypothetical protein